MDKVSYVFHEEQLWKAEGAGAPKDHRIHLAHTGCTVRVMELGKGPPVLFLPGAPMEALPGHRWPRALMGSAVSFSIDPAPG